jgi:UDP:flavonoid glycosyltransferase YjiC (YdhE family)
VSSSPELITISAAGSAATVERALGVATELAAAGLHVQILAFDAFFDLVSGAGIRFCSAPGDLADFEARAHGSIAAFGYLASAAPGMSTTLDGRLRDSTMIVLCDDSPLIPSIAEARGLPIFRVRGAIGEARSRRQRCEGLARFGAYLA